MRLSVILFFSLFLLGCSTNKPLLFSVQNAVHNEVWPQAPEKPRYRFIGELQGESFNPEIHEQSWLDVIIGFITGKPKPTMLKRPYSIHVSADNRVFVADVGIPGVMVFNLKDNTVQVWKDVNDNQSFMAPVSVISVKNEVWVSDVDLGAIYRFSMQGEPLGAYGSNVLSRPIGMAFDSDKQVVYVADSSVHNIKVFDLNGRLVKIVGDHGDSVGQFNFPSLIEFKGENLYVSDTMNARIQVLQPDLNNVSAKVVGNRGLKIGNTPRPKGVATDSDGNIYIVESFYGYLLVFNKNGELLLPLSAQGRKLGRFELPVGVTVDHLDRVYIADTYNGRVVMLQYLGND